MTRRGRLVLFLVAAAGVGVLYVLAVTGLPAFGGAFHPYRDAAVAAAVAHSTPNVVSAVNYDLRALDTLGEETILLGSIVGAVTLLRAVAEERKRTTVAPGGRQLEAVRLAGYLLLPLTLLLGVDLVVHGHLTPGGGFQGGVVLGTAVHLLYLTGHYRALERVRPVPLLSAGEAVGTGGYAVVGLAGILGGGSFLANALPLGTFGALPAAGTVPVLNAAVGVAVGCGVVVLLAAFFEQALRVERS